MNNFKRYGFPNGELGKDNDVKEKDIVVGGGGVPKKFTQTKSRKRVDAFLKWMGIFCLSLVALIPVVLFTHVVAPFPAWAWGYLKVALVVLASVCHLGFVFEAAASNTNRSYFAIAAGILWIGVILTGVIMLFIHAVH